jgi:hypothetical protein
MTIPPKSDFVVEILPKQMAHCRIPDSQYRASALNQPNQNCNYCQNQENVNKSPQRIRADHTQQPKNQKQNGYSPEHRGSFPLRIQQL